MRLLVTAGVAGEGAGTAPDRQPGLGAPMDQGPAHSPCQSPQWQRGQSHSYTLSMCNPPPPPSPPALMLLLPCIPSCCLHLACLPIPVPHPFSPLLFIHILSTVGLISPDQDPCIAQGYNVDCSPQASYVCESVSPSGFASRDLIAEASESAQTGCQHFC